MHAAGTRGCRQTNMMAQRGYNRSTPASVGGNGTGWRAHCTLYGRRDKTNHRGKGRGAVNEQLALAWPSCGLIGSGFARASGRQDPRRSSRNRSSSGRARTWCCAGIWAPSPMKSTLAPCPACYEQHTRQLTLAINLNTAFWASSNKAVTSCNVSIMATSWPTALVIRVARLLRS